MQRKRKGEGRERKVKILTASKPGSCILKPSIKKIFNISLKNSLNQKLNRLFIDNHATLKSLELNGCTIPEFKTYLEAKFLPGMSFENYGSEWYLSRIAPFCDFNLTDEDHAKQCFHFSNVSPLFVQGQAVDRVLHIDNAEKDKS